MVWVKVTRKELLIRLKSARREFIRINVVRLEQVWVGLKPEPGKGNLADEVVDSQQEQRQ